MVADFKSRLAKAAGAEVAVRRTGEKWHAAVAKKHISKSKCAKHHIPGSHFGSSDVQKWHAAVARSIFVSRNAQNTTWAEPFLEVAMFKNGTPLWREAYL